MSKANRLVGATLACMAGLGFHVPGSAQQKSETVEVVATDAEMRERNTNKALLQALLARRAEIARTESAAQDRRAALEFLERRIAQVRSRVGQ